MLENFNKSINPHNNSAILEKLDLELLKKVKGTEEYIDKNNNDNKYFKKRSDWGEYILTKEHFMSLLIKGIFHSSEIARIGDDFFSREIELKNTEKGLPLEKESEVFILKSVLGDFDKALGGHNSIQNEDGKFSHFDFGYGFESAKFNDIHNKSKNAYKIFSNFCKRNNFSDEDVHNFSLQVLNKLNALELAVNDKNFIFAILKKTNFQPLYQLEKIYTPNKTVKRLKSFFNKNEGSKDIEELNFIRIKKLLLKPIKAMKNVAEKEIKNSRN